MPKRGTPPRAPHTRSGVNRKSELIAAVEVIANLVRNIHLKRELHLACANPHQNFWRVIYGDLMDIAVLEWCKLFGSDDSERQPIHWKNLALRPTIFIKGLLKSLGLTEAQWRDYWVNMKTYRDKSVAHHDPERKLIKNYPKLDIALMSSCYLYKYVRRQLIRHGVDQRPKSISLYGKAFARQSAKVATVALNATRKISAAA